MPSGLVLARIDDDATPRKFGPKKTCYHFPTDSSSVFNTRNGTTLFILAAVVMISLEGRPGRGHARQLGVCFLAVRIDCSVLINNERGFVLVYHRNSSSVVE